MFIHATLYDQIIQTSANAASKSLIISLQTEMPYL